MPKTNSNQRIGVIGGGIGGLVSAIDLARSGCEVHLFERAEAPGGKLRPIEIAGAPMDAGPTVFTMPAVFEQLFDDAGDDFRRRVPLKRASILARHIWRSGELDLLADPEGSAAAINAFAGGSEAIGYLRFIAAARAIHKTLDRTFMQATRPSPLGLAYRIGLHRPGMLWNIRPFATLWNTTSHYFRDVRLRQLFSRYATYCGSSPYAAPATLMLIAHVEQAGVWYVQGGMRRLAVELAALAARLGCRFHYHAQVARIRTHGGRVSGIELRDGERLALQEVICNADSNALAQGLLGDYVRKAVKPTRHAARTLSAVTVNALARTRGRELAHHTVFFSDDYAAEFQALFGAREFAASPSLYVCAQDRIDNQMPAAPQGERLLCLMNAPATGDSRGYNQQDAIACTTQMLASLKAHGLEILCDQTTMRTTTPADFERLYPATGGALYGAASHGWRASFTRPGSRSAIQGLYLAGGSVHPGAGVPMAAISGRLAAACLLEDRAFRQHRQIMATPGGISTE